MTLRETLLVFAALVVFAYATEVSQCETGRKFEDTNEVQISGCNVPPCKLRRRSNVSVQQKFVPQRDVENLFTSVNAQIFNVPLPFIGVDGMNACKDIYNADGSKAGCPLRKGVEYIYKTSFPILEVYPKLSMVVHYSLVDGNDVITCFEVPSKITG